MRIPLRGVVHPVAASLAQPEVRFRLPEFERLKAAYTDKDLKIPEAVIKDRVRQLLERMEHDGRLKSTDPVATIVAKIFPGAGKIDEAAFDDAVDTADQESIYRSVMDANTKVKKAERAGLRANMTDAIDLIRQAEADAAGLAEVFGSKATAARAIYGKARKSLADLSKNLDKRVSTDYNLDDPEVGLGGWANFGAKHVHLLISVVKGTDPKATKSTLIHESSHLADTTVDDLGYYGSPGFEAMSEDEKVANAAHFEELPRRLMGTSVYATTTFTPGVKKGGGAMTHEDIVRRDASEVLRMAWDAAVDAHLFVRGVRKSYLKGSSNPFKKSAFKKHRPLIMEISRLMDLTIHRQAAGRAIVTTLDVTLTESIARGVSQRRRGRTRCRSRTSRPQPGRTSRMRSCATRSWRRPSPSMATSSTTPRGTSG